VDNEPARELLSNVDIFARDADPPAPFGSVDQGNGHPDEGSDKGPLKQL
jgi:hypothetical protein